MFSSLFRQHGPVSDGVIFRPQPRRTFVAPASSKRRGVKGVVDLMLPAAEKITLVLEGLGDDKIRVNSSSLDHPLTILPDQALEIVAIENKVMVGRTMRSAYW
jgi:hypothetical protein